MDLERANLDCQNLKLDTYSKVQMGRCQDECSMPLTAPPQIGLRGVYAAQPSVEDHLSTMVK